MRKSAAHIPDFMENCDVCHKTVTTFNTSTVPHTHLLFFLVGAQHVITEVILHMVLEVNQTTTQRQRYLAILLGVIIHGVLIND